MASALFKRWGGLAVIGFAAATFVAAAPRDSAVIVDSGSTNTLGSRIEVWSDGTAAMTLQQKVGASPPPAKSFTVPMATVKQFFADLAAARKGNAATVPCMKSASFGTTTRVTWQGWVSPDLTCPPKDALGAALIADVQRIREASGAAPAPLRQGPVEMESPGPPDR